MTSQSAGVARYSIPGQCGGPGGGMPPGNLASGGSTYSGSAGSGRIAPRKRRSATCAMCRPVGRRASVSMTFTPRAASRLAMSAAAAPAIATGPGRDGQDPVRRGRTPCRRPPGKSARAGWSVAHHNDRPAELGQRIGQRLADRDADDGPVRSDADALGEGHAAANAGEAAGTDGHRDQVEIGRLEAGVAQAVLCHDRQDRGVAAVEVLLIAGHDRAVGDDGRRTSRNGRIESKYPHGGMKLEHGQAGWNAWGGASPAIGSTPSCITAVAVWSLQGSPPRPFRSAHKSAARLPRMPRDLPRGSAELLRTGLERVACCCPERGGLARTKLQARMHASSKERRGERSNTPVGSPWPRLTRKFDRQPLPEKNAASTVGIVEARHRSDIQAQRARGDHQVGALQGPVAERRGRRQRIVAGEPGDRIRIVREKLWQLLDRTSDRRRRSRSPARSWSFRCFRPTAPGASFCLPSLVRMNTKRAGELLAEVGPNFRMS